MTVKETFFDEMKRKGTVTVDKFYTVNGKDTCIMCDSKTTEHVCIHHKNSFGHVHQFAMCKECREKLKEGLEKYDEENWQTESI